MLRRLFLFVSLFVVLAVTSSLAGRVTTSQQRQLPRGQIADLGRPTEKSDEVPVFDYEQYFPGQWHFEWRVPESPLGPGGTLTGTETFAGGEWFRSGSVWNLGKGKVFYFRPGHETYPVFKEKLPLLVIENAVRWLAAELPKGN